MLLTFESHNCKHKQIKNLKIYNDKLLIFEVRKYVSVITVHPVDFE